MLASTHAANVTVQAAEAESEATALCFGVGVTQTVEAELSYFDYKVRLGYYLSHATKCLAGRAA